MSEHNAPWVVSNCGNPEYGPGWECHRVTDSTGCVMLRNVTRSVAEAYAQIPALHAAVAAARVLGRKEGFEKAREMAAGIASNTPGGPQAVVSAIRAMRDGAGGEGCRACGHVFHDDNKCPGCTANGTQCIRDDS